MHLGEISEDYSVSVNVMKGDASATFSSKPAFFEGGRLFVMPFRYDNQIINFGADGLFFEFSAVRDGEVPYFWKNVNISREVRNNEVFHAISSDVDGVRLNRRNAFRVFIGLDGEAINLDDKKSHHITVKDISSTGIGILSRKNEDPLFEVGNLLQVRYRDEDFYIDVDITCRVVRMYESDVGYVYGCQFSRLYPKVENYVAQRQLKKAKKK